MAKPTTQEVIAHLREHFGLSLADTLAVIKAPLHPAGLRDELAGRAMQSLVQVREASLAWADPDSLAKTAYIQADAMLKARITKGGV